MSRQPVSAALDSLAIAYLWNVFDKRSLQIPVQ